MIVPVYNGAAFIGEAIASILAQPVAEPLEIIVVDDGSTDATVAALARFAGRIRLVQRANGGVSAARNSGLAVANGTIIGFLDADDLWTDRHLVTLLPLLAGDDRPAVARGRTRIVPLTAPEAPGQELTQPVLVGAALYRRDVVDRVGGFDEALRLGEDIDFSARIAEAGFREVRDDAVVLLYRRHGAATVTGDAVIARGQFDALRKRLARERLE